MRDALPALAESRHFVLEATSALKTGRVTSDFATELSSRLNVLYMTIRNFEILLFRGDSSFYAGISAAIDGE